MARLLGEQPKQSLPDNPPHQFFCMDTKAFQLRDVISPACPGSALPPPPPLGHVGTPRLRVTQEILEESHLNEQAPHLSLLKVRDWPYM